MRTCTLGWNLLDDTLTMGQWLKGRLFPECCDLSPDGKYFVYFALNGKWKSESRGTWTALSLAPYLKALSFWPDGTTWRGGGQFLSKNYVFLYASDSTILVSSELNGTQDNAENWDTNSLNRLPRSQRDGWQFVETQYLNERRGTRGITVKRTVTIWEKPLDGVWILRKLTKSVGFDEQPHGKSSIFDEHQLVNRQTGEEINGKEWEWADFDKGRNRVLWAQGGKIFARSIEPDLGEVRELFDLNPMTFEPLVAPY